MQVGLGDKLKSSVFFAHSSSFSVGRQGLLAKLAQ